MHLIQTLGRTGTKLQAVQLLLCALGLYTCIMPLAVFARDSSVKDVESRGSYFLSLFLYSTEETLLKLPIYVKTNSAFMKNTTDSSYHYYYGNEANKPGQPPFIAPFPERIHAPFRMSCNENFSLEKLFKNDTSINLPQEIQDKKDTFLNVNYYVMNVAPESVGYPLMVDFQGWTTKDKPRSTLDEVEYCIYQGLPRKADMVSGSPQEDLYHALSNSTLWFKDDKYGSTQDTSFIFDSVNEKYYDLSSSTIEEVMNVLNCTKSTSEVYEACSLGDVACECNYKTGTFDVVKEIKELRNFMRVVDDNKDKTGPQYWQVTMAFIFLCICRVAALYNPIPRGFMGTLFMNKIVLRLYFLLIMAKLLKVSRAYEKTFGNYCFKNKYTHPTAGDDIRKLLPGFNCEWHYVTSRLGSITMGSLLQLITTIGQGTSRQMPCTNKMKKVPFYKTKTENTGSFCSQKWTKCIAGIFPHCLKNKVNYNSTTQSEDTIVRNQAQLAKFQPRRLQSTTISFDMSIPLFKWIIYYLVFILMFLMTVSYGFLTTIKPNNLTLNNELWKPSIFWPLFSFMHNGNMKFEIEMAICTLYAMLAFIGLTIHNGIVTNKMESITSINSAFTYVALLGCTPLGAAFKTQNARQAIGLGNAVVNGYTSSHPKFIAVMGLLASSIQRLPRYVFFFVYSLTMQEFLGRQNRILYTCIRWLSIMIFIVSIGSWWLYFCGCGIMASLTVIDREIQAEFQANLGGEASYRDVCYDPNDRDALYGWVGSLPENSLQHKVDVAQVPYTDYFEVDFIDVLNRTFMDLDMAKMKNGTQPWHSLYLDNVQVTLIYTIMQIITTAGLGDIPPATPSERILTVAFMLLAILIIQTNFLNAISAYISALVSEKNEYLRVAYGMYFVNSKKSNHRIERSQSVLYYHWKLWDGMMPLSPQSADMNFLPKSVKQELTYTVLGRLLKTKKSTIIQEMLQSSLRYLSDEMEYYLIPKGDIVPNSSERQQFVLILYSGSLTMLDANKKQIGQVNPDKVHYEVECFLGLPPGFSLVGYSSYTEIFLIKRHHFLNVIHMDKKLHNNLVKRVHNVSRLTERSIDHFTNKLEEKTEGIMGFGAPLSSRHDYELPKISDVQNYIEYTPNFTIDKDALIDKSALDGESKTIIKIAEAVCSRDTVINKDANDRTSKRLAPFVKEFVHNGLEENIASTKARATIDRPANFFTASKTIGREIITRTESSLVMAREDQEGLTYESLYKNYNKNDGRALKIQSVISRPMLPKDSNVLSHMDFHHIFHGDVKDKPSGLYFVPDSNLINAWNVFHSIHSFIAIYVISSQFAFYPRFKQRTVDNPNFTDPYKGTSFYYINYGLIDFIQILQWFVIMRTATTNEEHILTWNWKQALSKYGNSKVTWLAVGTIPIEMVFFIIGQVLFKNSTSDVKLFSYYFLNFRILRLLCFYSNISDYLSQTSNRLFASPWKLLIKYLLPVFVIIQVTVVLSYYLLCTTSMYFSIPEGKCREGSWPWELFGDGRDDTSTPIGALHRYVNTYYFKLKVYTTFNHGNILPGYAISRIFMTMEMFLGVLFLSLVTALVTTILLGNTRQSLLSDFKNHWFNVKGRLAGTKCIERVMDTKRMIFNRYCGFACPGLFDSEDNLFPMDKAIVKENEMEGYSNYIPLFMDLPSAVIVQLALVSKKFIFPKNQIILEPGSVVDTLYFLVSGNCELLDCKGNQIGYFESGQVLTMLEFAGKTISKNTIRTTTGCTIVQWSYEDVDSIFDSFRPWTFLSDIIQPSRKKVKSLTIKPKQTSKISEECKTTLLHKMFPGVWCINPYTIGYLVYSIFQRVRILIHICFAVTAYSYMPNNANIKKVIFALDCIAWIDIIVRLFTSKIKSGTNIMIQKTASNMSFYFKNGFVHDLLVSLPWERMITAYPILGCLRIFQIRQAFEFFNYLKESIHISPAYDFLLFLYLQMVSVVWFSAILFKMAKSNGLKCAAIEGCKAINITLDEHTITIPENSWVGSAYAANRDGDGFLLMSFTSSYEFAVLGLYYISDCMTGVGAGHMYPKALNIKIVEFLIQIVGWNLNLIIAAQFGGIVGVHDLLRQNIETSYICIQDFFNKSGKDVAASIKKKVLKGYQLTWKNKTGDLDNYVFKGLPSELKKDAAVEMYSDVLEPIFKNDKTTMRTIAPHIDVLSTTSDTFIVKSESIADYGYIVEQGEFEVYDENHKLNEILRRGNVFIPKEKTVRSLKSVKEGKLYTIPLDDLKNVTLPNNKETTPEPLIKHFQVGNRMILAGVISFLLATYRIYFLKAEKSFNTMAKISNLTDEQIASTHVVEYIHKRLDIVIFLWTLIGIFMAKFKSHEKKFNVEEFITLVASIPFVVLVANTVNDSIILEYQWIIKLLWFYLAEFVYDRKMDNLEASTYGSRIFKYGIWAYVTVHIFSCFQYRYLCPKYCLKNSMAENMYGMYVDGKVKFFGIDNSQNYTDTDNIVHNVTADNAVYFQPTDNSNVYLDTIYIVLSLFSATGHGNIVPESMVIIIWSIIHCLSGRCVLGLVLGFSQDITDKAVEALSSGYMTVRLRIANMLEKVHVNEWNQKYILGYIDANYLRCKNIDIRDTFEGQVLSPALKKDLLYSAFGEKLKHMKIFNGISEACLREICIKATVIENYYSGHVIQAQGCPLDGIMMIMTGVVVLGRKEILIDGEYIFAHHFYDNVAISEVNVYAYSRTELLKFNSKIMNEVFEYYPKDSAIFKLNINSAKVTSATAMVPLSETECRAAANTLIRQSRMM